MTVRAGVALGAFVAALLSSWPASPQPAAVARFSDVSADAGVDVNGLGNASAWADVDVDGDLDLLATDSDIPNGYVYLYRNDGDGTFTDVSAQSGLNASDVRSAAWGDYDNDGDPDLAATSYSSGSRARLYRNDGNGANGAYGHDSLTLEFGVGSAPGAVHSPDPLAHRVRSDVDGCPGQPPARGGGARRLGPDLLAHEQDVGAREA